MPNRPTSATGRKWQAYNRWRAKHRALDRQRRLERLAERRAEFVAGYSVGPVAKPLIPEPVAIVRITFAGGKSASFRIRETPHGWSTSPTMAGRRVSELLKAAALLSRSH